MAPLARLRHLGDFFNQGNQFCRSLGHALDAIIAMIGGVEEELCNIISYRQARWEFYVNGLSYQNAKKLKITKGMLYSLFRGPSTNMVPSTNRPHISIDRCIEPSIKENGMDMWYIVFNEDPHATYARSVIFCCIELQLK